MEQKVHLFRKKQKLLTPVILTRPTTEWIYLATFGVMFFYRVVLGVCAATVVLPDAGTTAVSTLCGCGVV